MRSSFLRFMEGIKVAEVGVSSGNNALDMMNKLPHAEFFLRLKQGGTIGGHDAGREGVSQAIREFFKEGLIVEGEDWRVIKYG